MFVALALVTAWASAAPVEGDLLLQTRNTTMAFHKSGDTWLMIHYGAKIETAGDIAALAAAPGSNTFGNRKPATYSVYGADASGDNMNKYGALAVIHADGVTSTELQAVSATLVDDKPASCISCWR